MHAFIRLCPLTFRLALTAQHRQIRTGDPQTMHLVVREAPAPTATTATNPNTSSQPHARAVTVEPATTQPRPFNPAHHPVTLPLANPNNIATHPGIIANANNVANHAGVAGGQALPNANVQMPHQNAQRRNPPLIPASLPPLHPYNIHAQVQGQPRTASPFANHNAEQAAAFQQHHQQMTTWLTQLQRETRQRATAANRQRLHDDLVVPLRDNTDNGNGNGRDSPLGHFYRETVGPNGHGYQVEAIIRGSTFTPNPATAPLSIPEAQNILRQADMGAMANAMQRGVHRATLHPRHSHPSLAAAAAAHQQHHNHVADSRTGSGRATPDLARAWGGLPVGPGATTAGATPIPSLPRQPVEVYVLSSPEGPRALLVHNGSGETYYTPRLRTQPSHPHLRNIVSPVSPAPDVTAPNAAEPPQQNPQPEPQPHVFAQDNLPDGQPGRPGDGIAGPHNPQAHLLPPLLIQAWPHIWLLFRLGIFVWFFTSPSSSWSRWLSVVGLALFIFVLSIGALRGVADMAWQPFAHHLEHLLPRPEPHGGRGNPNANRNPNPADMAARLVAQQRARETWFRAHIRRLERAGLLFLASIAPGVAEAHIARLEAEARAERQRLEAEAEAARRQAEEAATATAAANGAEGSSISAQQEEAPPTNAVPGNETGPAPENPGGQPAAAVH
jgi:hypothetical protein